MPGEETHRIAVRLDDLLREREMTLTDYAAWWANRAGSETDWLYLKDWHVAARRR